jgi:4-amino-4-deoxy-L-arabinose transferase-like glycosyltransferase
VSARWRVGGIAAATFGLLVATANGYGYHRDELYFREAGKHLQWGYPDQPPLTPLIGRISSALFGDTPRGLRVASALAVAACIVLCALVARELGGGAAAQTIAAGSVAVSGFLLAGHLLSTATFDIFFWTLLGYLLVRLVRRDQPRLWLALGAVTGVALLNKHLVLLFWAAVGTGLVVARRTEVLRARYTVAAVVIAGALWAPNLAWQASHGWPQLTLAHEISGEDTTLNRIGLVPFQLLLIGPLLAIVWIGGLVFLFRRAERWIALAYIVLLVLTFVVAGKPYYVAGFYPLLLGAGAVWLETRRPPTWLLAGGAAVSLAVSAFLALPLVPARDLHATPIPALNDNASETVGWPALVREVARVHRRAPDAVVFTVNYAEAGAIDRYGRAFGLPHAYSGHNAYAEWGPPPPRRQVVVVGARSELFLYRTFRDCRLAGHVDNGVELDNEEQGAPIWLCTLRIPWSRAWRLLEHLDA